MPKIHREAGRLPPAFDRDSHDVALVKKTTIKEGYSVTFRAESFNLTNTPIRPGPWSTSFTSSTFGIIPNAQNNFPRLVQLAVRLDF